LIKKNTQNKYQRKVTNKEEGERKKGNNVVCTTVRKLGKNKKDLVVKQTSKI